MTYLVRCNRDRCPFNERKVADLNAVFDLQDAHRENHGENHILEFERLQQEQVGTRADD